MSEIQFTRRSRWKPLTIGTASSSSSTVSLANMAGGAVMLSAPSTAATVLRVYGSVDGTTFSQLYGSDGAEAAVSLFRVSGTAVETVGEATQEITVYTAVAGAYAVPDSVFSLRYIRLVSDAEIGGGTQIVFASKS